MHGEQDADTAAPVRRVLARVDLQATALAELKRLGTRSLRGVHMTSGTPESLNVYVSLSAEDNEGRRIASEGFDFGMSGPRRGIWHRWHGPPLPEDREAADRLVLFEHHVDLHDIEDGINQMLGRDPTLHHPPRLSWGKLIAALDDAGVSVTERDLIQAPLTIDLAPEVEAELDRP